MPRHINYNGLGCNNNHPATDIKFFYFSAWNCLVCIPAKGGWVGDSADDRKTSETFITFYLETHLNRHLMAFQFIVSTWGDVIGLINYPGSESPWPYHRPFNLCKCFKLIHRQLCSEYQEHPHNYSIRFCSTATSF